jgi:hypothetical protein
MKRLVLIVGMVALMASCSTETTTETTTTTDTTVMVVDSCVVDSTHAAADTTK